MSAVPLRSWMRSAAEAWEVPRDLLLRRYPAFVGGGSLRPAEIPVFVFHSAEPDTFSRKLSHLADNGYLTLSVDEYLAVIRGERKAPQRAVLLTFDDGRGSVWTVAAPLLRRHAMKAVVFLVPGRMRQDGGGLTPSLDDVEAARGNPTVIRDREQGTAALLSWDEVEALARTGLFDFQSHSHRHARIHTAPELDAFVTPRSREGYAGFDQPLLRASGSDLVGPDAPLGAPLFRSAPRTSEALRFLEDESVRRPTVELVAESGGEAFFAHADWERRLRGAFGRTRVRGTVESGLERERAIAFELSESRRQIEAHTGRRVVHLCYPWHTAGPTARRLAAELGYVTAFCGKVHGVPITMPGGDPLSIARLGEDYVELLPGAGRATLAEILRRKWRRRFGRTLE